VHELQNGDIEKAGYHACIVLLEVPIVITQALAQSFAPQNPHCFLPELPRFFSELFSFFLRVLLRVKPRGNEHTKD